MSTPRNYKIAKWLMGISACTILGFGLMSFQDSARKKTTETQQYSQSVTDTVPEKISGEMSTEINKAMKEVSEALTQVGQELKKIDWNKMGNDVEISLKEVNIEKIMNEVRQAIEKADIPKITRELNIEMNKADGKKLEAEIEKELKEGLKEFKDINWKEIEEKLKDIKVEFKDFDKAKFKAEMEKIKPVIKEKMEELKQELKKIEKEQKKASKSGYACIPKCKKFAEMDMEFTPDVSVEPMI